jgi:hypothetical protein
MASVAQSALRRVLTTWVQCGRSADELDGALLEHELSEWTGGRTGHIDESYAEFKPAERWIAGRLAAEGHNVVALPICRSPSVKSPDAAVSGLQAEFKTFTGSSPRQLLGRVGRALCQADRVVIHTVALHLSHDIEVVFRAVAHSAERRGLRAVKFIGPQYHLEWGEWNGRLTPSRQLFD